MENVGNLLPDERNTGNRNEQELNNLMYEIESAKRQIASLQGMLAGKTKETAALQARLIERDVLIKQAAACIQEAMELCRRQAEFAGGAYQLYRGCEEEWETLERRMRKVQEELPPMPETSFFLSENLPAIERIRANVDVTVKEAEARLRKIFEN